MLNQISNLGKTLTTQEQKAVNGGKKFCKTHAECGPGSCCAFHCSVCVPSDNNQGLCDGGLSI